MYDSFRICKLFMNFFNDDASAKESVTRFSGFYRFSEL